MSKLDKKLNPYRIRLAELTQGKDNYGKPRADYLSRLNEMDNEALERETEHMVWLAAYAANNPRSDYHWQVDVCYYVCEEREGDLYKRAYRAIEAQVRGY